MFTVYGPGITNPIPLEKLFVRPAVMKASAIAAKQAIKAEMDNGSSPAFVHQSAVGKQKYQAAESVNKRPPSLKAAQIMTAPVTYVLSTASVSEAMKLAIPYSRA